jgi:hypothetical protein
VLLRHRAGNEVIVCASAQQHESVRRCFDARHDTAEHPIALVPTKEALPIHEPVVEEPPERDSLEFESLLQRPARHFLVPEAPYRQPAFHRGRIGWNCDGSLAQRLWYWQRAKPKYGLRLIWAEPKLRLGAGKDEAHV